MCARTSGSTGMPKDILLLKHDMLISARNTNEFFGIDSGSVLGLPLSIDYIAGKMMVVRSLAAGCRLRQFPVSNTVVVDERIDLLSVVPSQVPSILADAGSTGHISNLLIGGAPLSRDLERRIVSSGINAFIGYGMTETCSHVALRRLGEPSMAYHAMPNIAFSTDSRGCLVVHADDFSWHSLTTNDVVDMVDERSFVWRGRADNVINSGGIKLHPEEIERRLSCVVIQPFYVVRHPSEKWGECVALVAEGDASATDMLWNSIDSLELPKGWKPAVIIMTDRLPRTSNGKIRRLTAEALNRTC